MSLSNGKFNRNTYIMLPLDAIFAVLSYYFAYYWRFDGSIPAYYMDSFLALWAVYAIVKVCSFYVSGVYKRIWKYAGVSDLVAVIYSQALAILILLTGAYFLQVSVPRSVYVFTFMMDIFVSAGTRIIPKLYREKKLSLRKAKDGKRLLIVGAGDAGFLVAKELLRHGGNLLLVGFIDDDPDKQNLKILGLPVLGNRKDLVNRIRANHIEEVLIAIPSADGQVIREILEDCRTAGVTVRTLPRMYDIINGQITVDLIREVKLEDLLGREPVQLDMDTIAGTLAGKKIMVTGAGGSIGSELCRQISRFGPRVLIMLGHDENPIFETELELKSLHPNLLIKSFIADVQDRDRIQQVFNECRPEVVFHAAAHKHVPLMEINPGEAFKNNVLGTKNVADASDHYSVETFILISTDKAVNPTSVMGATKRMAEMIVQNLNEISTTKYAAVRFGNVLGSRGSVIPIFQEQIRRGGPVTVTHPDMQRYFMTIPEAVQLVLQAATMTLGGEIFILDMGIPVRIVDMAKELIRLSGFEPEKDIAIEYSGIRPGEKLYEEILTDLEGISVTKHKRIYVSNHQYFNKSQMDKVIKNISQRKYLNQREQIFETLKELENPQAHFQVNIS